MALLKSKEADSRRQRRVAIGGAPPQRPWPRPVRSVVAQAQRTRPEETQGRGPAVVGASAACAVLHPSVGRVPLDAPPVWADPPAHRATHVASGLIERTAHGGSEARGGAIPVGVSQ